MDLGLRGQVAVVTGGSGGIGSRVAAYLAGEGCHIAVVDQVPPAAAAVQAVESHDVSHLYVECNVRQRDSIMQMADRVLRAYGKIDILINGVGVGCRIPVVDITEAEWDRIQEINLKSTLFCSQAFIPHMTQQRRGKIVNIASGLGHTPMVHVGAYAAAKAGVIVLSKTLALELATYGITVNSVAPGIVDTPFIAHRSRAEVEAIAAKIPLGRLGQPDDVAMAIVFLASPAADYITGQTLFVTGGALMV